MQQAFSKNLGVDSIYKHQNLSSTQVDKLRRRSRRQLERQLSVLNARDAILSAEAMSAMTEIELEDVHRFFSEYFDEISVHIFYRPMKSRMESAFQERLKHRRTSLTEKFPLGYLAGVQKLDRVFGQENVHVHKYCRDHFPNGDIVQYFLEAIGEQYLPTDNIDDNRSLSLPATQLLYHYRQEFPAQEACDQQIVEKLSTLIGQPLRFHSSLYKELLVTGENAISNFEKRAGFSINEDLESHDEMGIKNEADLLNVPGSSLQWLHDHARESHLNSPGSKSNESIAALVRSLVEPRKCD